MVAYKLLGELALAPFLEFVVSSSSPPHLSPFDPSGLLANFLDSRPLHMLSPLPAGSDRLHLTFPMSQGTSLDPSD